MVAIRRTIAAASARVLATVRDGPGLGLARLPGVGSFHRLLARAVAVPASRRIGPVMVRAFGLSFYVYADDEGVGGELVRTRSYEPEETALFAATIRPGMTVIDVGANLGVYTALAARAVGPTGRVFAFEPDPRSFALLVKTIAENGFDNVVAVPKGLSSRSGTATLYRLDHQPGLSSLSRANARGSVDELAVEVLTLDEFLDDVHVDRIDLLKLDVQGNELDVIRGAARILRGCAPTVFFEFWPAGVRNLGGDPIALLRLLSEFGYSFRTVDDPSQQRTFQDLESVDWGDGGTDLIALSPSPPARGTESATTCFSRGLAVERPSAERPTVRRRRP